MTTLALIASPGKIRALKIGLVRHLKLRMFGRNQVSLLHTCAWLYLMCFGDLTKRDQFDRCRAASERGGMTFFGG